MFSICFSRIDFPFDISKLLDIALSVLRFTVVCFLLISPDYSFDISPSILVIFLRLSYLGNSSLWLDKQIRNDRQSQWIPHKTLKIARGYMWHMLGWDYPRFFCCSIFISLCSALKIIVCFLSLGHCILCSRFVLAGSIVWLVTDTNIVVEILELKKKH
jgi:hypothetical protein